MLDPEFLSAILDSLTAPVLVADTGHVTRYMNAAAIAFYDGGSDLIGRSLLECHNEESRQMMSRILTSMQEAGVDEACISEKPGSKVFMRAVRDRGGSVIGYFERYQPDPGLAGPGEGAA
jgi:PAS domain-containing protein